MIEQEKGFIEDIERLGDWIGKTKDLSYNILKRIKKDIPIVGQIRHCLNLYTTLTQCEKFYEYFTEYLFTQWLIKEVI